MTKKWLQVKENRAIRNNSALLFALLFGITGAVLLVISFAAQPGEQKGNKNHQVVDARDTARKKANEAKGKLISQSPQLQLAALDLRYNPGKKATLAPKLKQLAAERKQSLLALMQNDPASARQFVLKDKALETLAENTTDVEQPATVTGSFGFKQIDDDSGDHMYGQVTTSEGKTYTLNDDHMYADISFGSQVTIRGYALDDQFLLAAAPGTEPLSQLASAPDVNGDTAAVTAAEPLTVTAAATVSPTTGPIEDVVMFANFSGGETATVDEAKLKAIYNGTPGTDIASWVSENSYGKASLNIDYYSFGSFPNISCSDRSAQYSAMKSALAAQTTKQYQVYTYLSNCGYYGTASRSGGNPPTIVISGIYTPYGHIHELAHTLGPFLGHGGYLDCGIDVFTPPQSYSFEPNPCVGQEYDDEYDVLGDGTHGEQLSASHKLVPGWLDSTQIATVSGTGTTSYTLAPYEKANSLVAIKIPRGNTQSYYTVEYRQKIGFDAKLGANCPTRCNADQGGLLRLAGYSYWGPGGGADSNIIDMTPESVPRSGGWWPSNDGIDGTLLPGKTFTDPEYGISIKVISADSTGLRVDVSVASTCNRANPTTSSLVPSSQTIKPGGSATYSMTVTNNDSAGCARSDFRFRSVTEDLDGGRDIYLPSQIKAVATPSYWTLAPGESKTINVTVSTSVHTVDGTYGRDYYGYIPLGYAASSSYDSKDAPVLGATLTVDSGTDTAPPTAPTNLTATALGATTAQLNWTPSTDGTAVAGYKIIVNNSGVFTTSQPNKMMTTLIPSSTYNFAISAIDRRGNASPAANVSVTTPAKSDTIAPVSPSNITASASDHDTKVSWQPSNDDKGVLRYVIYPYSISSCVSDIFSTSVTASCTQPNSRFKYPNEVNVLAVDADGNFSSRDSSTPELTTPVYGDAQAPTKPRGLYASSVTGDGGTLISWQPSTDDKAVVGYNVYSGASKIAYTTATTYTDKAVNSFGAGYRIQAVDSEGSVSQFSETFGVSGPGYYPYPGMSDTTPPTASIATPSGNSTVSGTVTLTANASDNRGVGAVSYIIDGKYIGQAATAPFSLSLDTAQYSDGPHEVVALANDIPSSVNGSCCFSNAGSSGPVTVNFKNIPDDGSAPTTPSNVSVSAPSAGQINITWTGSTDNVRVATYSIVRNGVYLQSVSGNSFTDLTVLPSTNYSYQVVANDQAGNSSVASATTSVKTPGLTDLSAPSQPSGLTASAVSTSQINLSWSASSDNIGVAGYDVYRNGAKVATTTTTSYGDATLSPGTAYSYYVMAKDAAGNTSAASATVSATTSVPPSTSASIQGVIMSNLNASLAGATVSVKYSGSSRTFTADSLGRYNIPAIPAGTYTFKYAKKGYASQSLSLTVPASQTVTQNVILQKNGK